MKRILKSILVFSVLVALVLPVPAFAAGSGCNAAAAAGKADGDQKTCSQNLSIFDNILKNNNEAFQFDCSPFKADLTKCGDWMKALNKGSNNDQTTCKPGQDCEAQDPTCPGGNCDQEDPTCPGGNCDQEDPACPDGNCDQEDPACPGGNCDQEDPTCPGGNCDQEDPACPDGNCDPKDPPAEGGNTGNNGNVGNGNGTGNSDNSGIAGSQEQQVLTLVNKERAAAGLTPLTMNTALCKVAEAKAADMRDKGYFSHTSPTYGSPFDMMQQFGIRYTAAGENIAKGYPTADAVMTGWMNSSGHKANILNSNYTQLGVGYVTDASGTGYWVQMFIRP